jgi:hypothetical protein
MKWVYNDQADPILLHLTTGITIRLDKGHSSIIHEGGKTKATLGYNSPEVAEKAFDVMRRSLTMKSENKDLI